MLFLRLVKEREVLPEGALPGLELSLIILKLLHPKPRNLCAVFSTPASLQNMTNTSRFLNSNTVVKLADTAPPPGTSLWGRLMRRIRTTWWEWVLGA